MKVRKIPIIVDAWKLDSKSYQYPKWIADAFRAKELWYKNGCWYALTMEGKMRAYDDDYVIKGCFDELYFCNKNVFIETYEII